MRLPRNKYHAQPTTVEGIRFASKREAKRYAELVILLRLGQISDLEIQPRYKLHAGNGRPVGEYRGDFRYTDCNGQVVVEDTKGFRTQLYKWKKRHVEAEYGIEVDEI